MTSGLWTPRRSLHRQVLRRPDLRGMARDLGDRSTLPGEVDYDDLTILRTWREYDAHDAGAVRHFVYELSQRDVGEKEATSFFKAVRFLRITRVPRYLRQVASASPDHVYEQHRDVLVALRERGALYLNLIFRADASATVFAYGVQAVGATAEEAKAAADESFEVLVSQIEGNYVQIEHQPLNTDEAEALVRYQREWRHIAMARGRPLPNGISAGAAAALLDGNRTDPESSANQLEAFLRGMGHRNYMMTLVTVPVSPTSMVVAWRNLTKKLSSLRSDMQGSRSFSASVAMPLAMGSMLGDTHNDAHTVGTNTAHTVTDGVNHSVADGTSHTHTVGSSTSLVDTRGSSHTGTHTATDGTGTSQSHAAAYGSSTGTTDTTSSSHAATSGQTLTSSETHGTDESVSSSRTVGTTHTSGSNWSNTSGTTDTATSSWTSGGSHAEATGRSQSFGLTGGSSDSAGTSEGRASNHSLGFDVGTGHPTLSQSDSSGYNQARGSSDSATTSVGGSHSIADVSNWSAASTAATAHSNSSSVGGSTSLATSDSSTSGTTYGTSHSVGTSTANTASATTTSGSSHATSLGSNQTDTATAGSSASSSTAHASADGTSVSRATGTGTSDASASGTSQTSTAGTSQSTGDTRGASDAWMIGMSRSASQTASLGVVPALGIVTTKQTFDEAKRFLANFVEAQVRRYEDGVNAGGFLYQLFIVTPDRETLAAASGLAKSAFWGPNSNGAQLPQPFHIVNVTDPDEAERLLLHNAAFTQYRAREHRVELIEPHRYSTYLTPGEGSALSHPPIAEQVGILAVHDSMPVFAAPSDRRDRDVMLGSLVWGERGKVVPVGWGFDLDEVKHMLIAGTTGSGKTTSLMKICSELIATEKDLVAPDPDDPTVLVHRKARASVLFLDWMTNGRELASVAGPGRFQLFSLARPELGEFRFNALALPDPGVSPVEWAGTIADMFMTAYSLGEFGRSIVFELIHELYSANRLVDVELRPAVVDDDGRLRRPAHILPAVDRASIPSSGIVVHEGQEVANVYSHPQLSRLVDMTDVAVMLLARIEQAATPQGRNLYGSEFANRAQSVWRRMMAFAPGGPLAEMFAADPALDVRETLVVPELVDVDRGLVTVVEADGLDLVNRKFVLGALVMSVWRYGQFHGDGSLNNGGHGPGTWVILEEAQELIGKQPDDDAQTHSTRTALWESQARRARALGMHYVFCAQDPSRLPDDILSNAGTVLCHRVTTEAAKRTIAALMNWQQAIGQHYREIRYLGELPTGYFVGRLEPKDHFLQAAPVHVYTEPVELPTVTNAALERLAVRRRGG